MIKLFLVSVLASLPAILSAQPSLKLGGRVGANYVNTIHNIDIDGYSYGTNYRFAYHAGIIGVVLLNNKLSVSPELLFSSKGYKNKGNVQSSPSGVSRVHYNYLSLPVLLGYRVHEKMTLSLGAEYSYLLSAKSRFDSETINLLQFWEGAGFDVNRSDIALGGSVELHLTDQLSLGSRYFHGLVSVVGYDVQLTDEQGNLLLNEGRLALQNRTFQLSVAYTLN